jgi:hypothetical protein
MVLAKLASYIKKQLVKENIWKMENMSAVDKS